MLYGHRNDVKDYGKAIKDFDGRLQKNMTYEDMIVLTAYSSCKYTTDSTDNQREYIPLLVYDKKLKGGVYLCTRKSFTAIVKNYFRFL